MRISIITATKNTKTGLLNAIECVRNQTYKDVEHIIVDGGSTDGTNEVMDDGRWMKDNVIYLSEPDNGIYDAINKGIRLATGDVIGLLHSDDMFADDNVLEKYTEVFKSSAAGNEQTAVEAVYSDLVYVSKKREVRSEKPDSGQARMTGPPNTNYQLPTTPYSILTTNYSIIRYWKAGDPSTPLRMTKWMKKGWMPPHPTLFVKKEIFDKYGLYRTDMKIAADYEMILRLFYRHKITAHYLPVTTYLMTIGGESNKSLKNILQKSREDYQSMKINGISFPLLTLAYKNLRKLPQFLARSL